MMLRIKVILFLMIFIQPSVFCESGAKTKSIYSPLPQTSAMQINSDLKRIPVKFNSKAVFKKAIKNDMIALLIGIDDYEKTNYESLRYCEKDILLISRILNRCCSVPQNKIFLGKNLTKDQCIQYLTMSIQLLKNNQSFLFYYSGHGDKDGSLIFSNGEKLSSEEFKFIINSFSNDTTIILDSCYSGYNEGVLDFKENLNYKENCVQIYSSLAHLQSKEISHSQEYFNIFSPFYSDVLGIKQSKGNGYFTSLLAMFFAEYEMSTKDNISINDMYTYISDKSKRYLEYLYTRFKGTSIQNKGERRRIELEYQTREKQLPKISPINKKIPFYNSKHQFLINFISTDPLGVMFEVSTSPVYTLTSIFKHKLNAALSVKVAFSPGMQQGFSIGLETGYYYQLRDEDLENRLQSVFCSSIPLLPTIGYRFGFGNDKAFLNLTASAGVIIGIWYFDKFLSLESSLDNVLHFGYSGGLGLGYYVSKDMALSLNIQAYGSMITSNNHIIGIRMPVAFSYRF